MRGMMRGTRLGVISTGDLPLDSRQAAAAVPGQAPRPLSLSPSEAARPGSETALPLMA